MNTPNKFSCIIESCDEAVVGLVAMNDHSTGLTICTLPTCMEHAVQIQQEGVVIAFRNDRLEIELVEGRTSEDIKADIELSFTVVDLC